MNVSEFKNKFERAEENSMGINSNVINKIINFVNCSKQSSDENIKFFLDNFDKMDKVYRNFNIFEAKKINGFSCVFKALNLTNSVDNLAIGHEIGHIVNSIKNIRFINPENDVKLKVNIPENFSEILDNAKANTLLPENKEFSKEYIQHLCKDKDISKAEKGPLSDILSAVFRLPGLRIGSYENVCYFPSSHESFYDENISENERLENIFDECFANMFSLKANNCEHELKIIEQLLGNDFVKMYDNEIEQACQIYKNEIEPEKSLTVEKLGNETLEEQKDVNFLLESKKLLSMNRESKEKE